ncbi:MAG: succinate dehydrogenase assembly factor 2 [Mariprofundaceae bacterium]
MCEQLDVRRLRYRLQRQGMLELDAWLAPLANALNDADTSLLQEIQGLLSLEPPKLLAVMHGEEPLPSQLKIWLEVKN